MIALNRESVEIKKGSCAKVTTAPKIRSQTSKSSSQPKSGSEPKSSSQPTNLKDTCFVSSFSAELPENDRTTKMGWTAFLKQFTVECKNVKAKIFVLIYVPFFETFIVALFSLVPELTVSTYFNANLNDNETFFFRPPNKKRPFSISTFGLVFERINRKLFSGSRINCRNQYS